MEFVPEKFDPGKYNEASNRVNATSQSIVKVFGVDYTISQLAETHVRKSLTARDKYLISFRMNEQSWLKNGSALEILLIRKKYEANYNLIPDIKLCGVLNDAYRNLCDTEIYGSRVCLIPAIFKSESRKVDKIMLQTSDLAVALLEDMLRNDQSKVFTGIEEENKRKLGFFNKKTSNKSATDLQKEHYHPARVIETASAQNHFFDGFVILAITGSKLPYEDIISAIETYRCHVLYSAKLVVVGVDHLKENCPNRDVHMISGVNEGSFKTLWDYVN